VGHDTELSSLSGSTAFGVDHAVPSKVRACPAWSTATQNAGLAQEIALGLPVESTGVGPAHVDPP
jgi:hypothetical protein